MRLAKVRITAYLAELPLNWVIGNIRFPPTRNDWRLPKRHGGGPTANPLP